MLQKELMGWITGALLAVLLIAPAQAGKRYCKVGHYHHGSASAKPTLQKAKAAAGASWASFTAWEYGSKWAHIGRSMGKKYSCSKAVEGWNCSVSAVPCVVRGTTVKKRRYVKRRKTYRKRNRNRISTKRIKSNKKRYRRYARYSKRNRKRSHRR